MIKKSKDFVKEKWTDPVWSKVFANFIWAILIAVFGFICILIKNIVSENRNPSSITDLKTGFNKTYNFLKETSSINNFLILVVISFLLLFLISLFRQFSKSDKKAIKRKTTLTERDVPDEQLDTLNHDDYDFFFDRLNVAFPGDRGLTWYRNPEEILHRLEVLLKGPLKFKIGGKSNFYAEPIWWFRGLSSSRIFDFVQLSKQKGLMDYIELKTTKIAVYKSNRKFDSFIYVEVDAD